MDLGNLKGLTIFAVVVEEGSFASAAKRLGMHRSAVSEQINKLEARLNARLLQRTTRQMMLTNEGERIFPSAKAILIGLEDSEASLLKDKPEGIIRVTTTHDFASNWLMAVVSEFKAQYPEIVIDYLLSDQRVDLVKGKVDLAIRVANIEEHGFIARPLFHDQASVYASPDLVGSNPDKISHSDVETLPWMMFESLNPNNKVCLSNDFDEIELAPSNYDICDSPIILRDTVLKARGLAMQPDRMMKEAVENGQAVKLLDGWYYRKFSYYLLYPSRKHLPMRLRLFIDFLLEFSER